jgi:hypothetical protein
MATGAVFQIIANDGRADRLIFATQLLNQRIKDIMCKRYNAGLYDISPTLADIGQSHVLLTDAKFKPLVAIGYEYNHAPTSSGTAAFGDTMTFSIPQFGDFFNDMVLSWHWSSFTGTEFTNPTQGTGDYANDDTPAAGTTSSTHTLVDSFGMAINDGETNNHLVRYVEYPAEAAIKKVSFHVNGNPLDAYGTETKVFLRKFMLDPGKAYGYRTLVGQENELEGYTDLQSSSQVDSDPSTSGTIAGDSVGRMKISVVNGPQTPKAVQPELHCMYPLDFSWNKSVALSIPSVSIPFGQRYMSFDLNKVEDVVRMAPNAYVRKVSTTYNAGGILPANVTSRIVEHISVPVVRSPELVGPTWKKAQLIINNLFVNPEIHDIYIKRIGFTLLRVFREHNFQTSDTNGQNLLAGLKWPVEYMFVGFRPVFNTKNTNDNIWRDWHRMHKTRTLSSISPCLWCAPLSWLAPPGRRLSLSSTTCL